jgi:hypothetical protein
MKEKLADAVHAIWSHWMKYMLSECKMNDDGSFVIPKEKVARWTRQMHTDYCDLSEKEKDSDRHIVDKFLGFVRGE